ncbi:MAG: glycoside hydrolase family 15 protein [Actinobacteria bacterium]|nr:glycoside hydrolase family 15 protein [Actinomycetota bacterium]
MSSAPYPAIGDYALIGDCHSAALVSRDGSIDWCCFHRFDARPVFARLLDWGRGGHFRIAPKGSTSVSRRYLDGTNVLETRFVTDQGVLTLLDCFPVRPTSDPAVAEAVHPYHQLIRLARCEEGVVELTIEFDPRFDYGLTYPRLEMEGSDVGVVYGGADALVFQSGLPVAQTDLCGCGTEAELRAGEEAFAVLTYALPHELRAVRLDPQEVARRIDATIRFWREWSERCSYDGPCREAVLRSALVLKALTNAPSGAIVAAPTTSLPEEVGGARNWDYRYTWLRDSALELYALFALGYTDEAHAFMGWLKRTTAGRAEDLQVVYGVGGERMLPEVELGALEGYRGSRPVRIGNGAANQFQLDVYGELVDTAWLYHRHGGRIDEPFWDFLRGVVGVVADRWSEPDEGIWEVRGGRQHFVSSKVMAWVAVDRAVRLARAGGHRGDVRRWAGLRDEIRTRVEAEGVDPETGTFLQAFGSRFLDASALLVPLVRFVPADDPRVRATVRRIERELSVEGLVYRYLGSDGLPGGEGAFVICSFWLVDNLALTGDVDRAGELFERLLGYANDVGLLAEQVDPASGDLLGNFPQSFSHVGLVGAALNLERALRRRRGETAPEIAASRDRRVARAARAPLRRAPDDE